MMVELHAICASYVRVLQCRRRLLPLVPLGDVLRGRLSSPHLFLVCQSLSFENQLPPSISAMKFYLVFRRNNVHDVRGRDILRSSGAWCPIKASTVSQDLLDTAADILSKLFNVHGSFGSMFTKDLDKQNKNYV